MRETDGVCQRLLLERSKFSAAYSVDVLIDFSAALSKPPPYPATIQGGADDLLREGEASGLHALLDLESSVEEQKREEELASLLAEGVLVRMDDLYCLHDLQAAFESGELRRFVLSWTARAALDPAFVPFANE